MSDGPFAPLARSADINSRASGVRRRRRDVRPAVDAKGRPVRDLKSGDFVLEEDGVPQEVESVQSVAPSQDTPAAVWTADRVSSNVASPAQKGRTFVVILDDIHLSPDGAKRSRAAVMDFMKRLPEHERISVISTSGQIWCTGAASRNDAAVVAALQRLKGLHIQDPLATDQMTEYEAMRIAQYDDAIALKNVEDRWQQEIARMERGGAPQPFGADRSGAADPFGSMSGSGGSPSSFIQGQDVPGEAFAAEAMSRHMQARARHVTMTAKALGGASALEDEAAARPLSRRAIAGSYSSSRSPSAA